jgi:hypothetical protein
MSNRQREIPVVGPLETESLNPSSLHFQLTFSEKRCDLESNVAGNICSSWFRNLQFKTSLFGQRKIIYLWKSVKTPSSTIQRT